LIEGGGKRQLSSSSSEEEEEEEEIVRDVRIETEADLQELYTAPGIARLNRVLRGQHLEVKDSTIPGAGLGLFATRRFMRGEAITMMGGKLVRTPDPNYEGRYAIELTFRSPAYPEVPVYLNGELGFWLSDAGRWSNSIPGGSRHNNTVIQEKLIIPPAGIQVFLQATSDIQAGDEIFTDYGANYPWHDIYRNDSALVLLDAVKLDLSVFKNNNMTVRARCELYDEYYQELDDTTKWRLANYVVKPDDDIHNVVSLINLIPGPKILLTTRKVRVNVAGDVQEQSVYGLFACKDYTVTNELITTLSAKGRWINEPQVRFYGARSTYSDLHSQLNKDSSARVRGLNVVLDYGKQIRAYEEITTYYGPAYARPWLGPWYLLTDDLRLSDALLAFEQERMNQGNTNRMVSIPVTDTRRVIAWFKKWAADNDITLI
jgi:hypothetical protein